MKRENKRRHQKLIQAYWDDLAETVIDNLKCSRTLPADVPEFILSQLARFEVDVTRFCFGSHDGLMLDAGCGSGNLINHALKLFPPGEIDYIGLDISRKMLTRARNNIKGKSKSNISFIQGSITDLPFKENTYNHIICNGILIYLNSPEEVIEVIDEFYRILKPNGILIFDFFNRLSPFLLLGQILNRPIPPQPQNLSPFWVSGKFKEAKFRIISYKAYDFKPMPGYLFMSTEWRWMDPLFFQEKLSEFIESSIVTRIPLISFLGYRMYFKCKK